MDPVAIVIVLELFQLSLEITRIPEQDVVKEFAANCADQSLDKWMGPRHIGETLDLSNIKDAEIGLPAVIGEKRVMVRAYVPWRFPASDDSVEHPA